jgi:Domain of unknown function (DUF6371)
MIHLEKYHGKNSRHICPQCQKKEFVRYIDDSGEYLSLDVGRCNRESSCGYHKKPKDYYAENYKYNDNTTIKNKQKRQRQTSYLTNTSGNSKRISKHIETIQQSITSQNVTIQPLITQHFATISAIKKKYLTESLRIQDKNNFIYFLECLFTFEEVQNLIKRFAIGTASDFKTVFWQIDNEGYIRTGRVMLFDKFTGKRSKVVHQNWIHSILIKRGLLKGFELKQCLFGEHQLLIETEKHKTVAIVESDKTAIIASYFMPEFIWMSAGAKGYLNAERMQPLANRKVILFPDTNAFVEWSEKVKTLRSVVPRLQVSNYLEKLLTEEQKKNGDDIADFLIEKRIKEVVERELYIEKLDAIKADDVLWQKLNQIIDERIAIMMSDGKLSDEEAEKTILLNENIQPIVLSNF